MEASTRACVAYVAGRAISGKGGSHVYVYSQSRHYSVSGGVEGKNVSIYDYERSCHFSGTLPSLYDYGRSAHVNIDIKGDQFSGYDYGDSHHFSGTVNGSSISLYDYGTSQHYSYTL